MRKLAVAAWLLALVSACDADTSPSPTVDTAEIDDVAYRCSGSKLPALGGLSSVSLSGLAKVEAGSGREFDVFSNGTVSVGALASVAGGLYSATGLLEIDLAAKIAGAIDPAGLEIPVDLPTAEAAYIKQNKHNNYIGTTNLGRSPILAGVLTMFGGDRLRLPHYYYYLDGLVLSGASRLDLTYSGTYIFVNGPIQISGGSIVGTSSAKHLLIVSMSAAPITISGNATSVLARIYAPLAPIIITTGANVNGAAVGGTLQMSGNASVKVTQDGLHLWYPC